MEQHTTHKVSKYQIIKTFVNFVSFLLDNFSFLIKFPFYICYTMLQTDIVKQRPGECTHQLPSVSQAVKNTLYCPLLIQVAKLCQ